MSNDIIAKYQIRLLNQKILFSSENNMLLDGIAQIVDLPSNPKEYSQEQSFQSDLDNDIAADNLLRTVTIRNFNSQVKKIVQHVISTMK
ncbi:12238_t:CDS:2, partial [Ambispora leptoticha]